MKKKVVQRQRWKKVRKLKDRSRRSNIQIKKFSEEKENLKGNQL